MADHSDAAPVDNEMLQKSDLQKMAVSILDSIKALIQTLQDQLQSIKLELDETHKIVELAMDVATTIQTKKRDLLLGQGEIRHKLLVLETEARHQNLKQRDFL